jgi:hypothetical protein
VASLVDQDVGRLQQGIAQEAVGREIPVPELFHLVLVRRHAFQPAERRDHREQKMQLGVFGQLRLDEERGLRRVDARREPVDHHVPHVALDDLGRVVVGRQGVPVGHEEIALELVLQPDPVLQHAVVVAEVQAAGGAHSREDAVDEHWMSIPGWKAWIA